jgi:hypothetical protein
MAPNKKQRQAEDDLLDWFTISYRTIYLGVAFLIVLAVGGGYWFYRHNAAVPPTPESPAPNVVTAQLITIEGNVKVKAVGTLEWVSADKSMVLQRGDVVRTATGSTAEIRFFDGVVVHLRPESLVTIETGEDPATNRRNSALHISSGKADFQTAVRAGSSITTPTATTRAGADTNGGVLVAETGDTEVKLYKGTGQVETKTGQKLTLANNEGVRVDQVGKAGPKLQLPPAPVLVNPPHQAEISYMDPERAVTLLMWRGVTGASSYHVMLDYSPHFNCPLVDRKGIKDSTVELRGLDLGHYYWRVSAADKDEVEGDYSNFSKFTVTRPTGPGTGNGPPPPLLLDPLDVRTNIVQVKGRTEPGATVTVNGQRVEVQEDGSFNEFITLQEPGKQLVIVRSTGINGGVNEQKRTVVVAY